MPRAGLTHDLVVGQAAQVADDLGWENLTLAAVAQRLGVSLPALYKHIGSLDGLRHDVAVLALTELAEVLTRAADGLSGQSALASLADAFRSFCQRHPGRYVATLNAPSWVDAEHSAAARSVLRAIYSTLEGYGLTGRDAADGVRSVRSVLHGFVSLETSGGFGTTPDLDRSFQRLVEGLDNLLSQWARQPRPGIGSPSGSATPG